MSSWTTLKPCCQASLLGQPVNFLNSEDSIRINISALFSLSEGSLHNSEMGMMGGNTS